MKTMATALLVLLLPLAAAGQDQQPAPKPDYSKPTLIRIFADQPQPPTPDRNVQWHATYVEFKALNMRWHINYLPFFAPLQGSFATTQGLEIPNPFILTHTELPYTPRTWHDERALSKELQRIEKMDRDRAKVKVQPQ